ncbi:universal stress protein [Paractinoplanes brasiliensis]|uniref:universal stress protein n=1 Tax=Paractinoplanes brasiliensis TaxID=52695 RepID=UPI0010600AA3|nr:universal stress protein [Actinoplanes brasiliensis]GID29837.1 hypothetical protein Abr02nite_48200 [Actinoplanes brasiliensis]
MRVLRGTPSLCAESQHAGLVVLGSGGIAGWQLGSVSYQVLHRSRGPGPALSPFS